MYQATLHLQLETECVLSDVARELGHSVDVQIEELHDHMVTFLFDAGDGAAACYDILDASDRVEHVEYLDATTLLVTKHSCGAYSAIYQNHAVLRRQNRVDDRHRIYNVLFFAREDLQDIIADFRDIGEVTLSSLTQVGDAGAELTPRQREVIQYAFDAGYFEWPRETTSEELADELGISRATCLEHLRKAEEKLLATMLDRSVDPEGYRPSAQGRA
ncbi:MAG: helix-turn-helix domain-containing protein [Haloplanus sp.]